MFVRSEPISARKGFIMSTTLRTTVTPPCAAAANDVVASSPFADYEKIHALAIRRARVGESSIESTAPAPIEEAIRYPDVRSIRR